MSNYFDHLLLKCRPTDMSDTNAKMLSGHYIVLKDTGTAEIS